MKPYSSKYVVDAAALVLGAAFLCRTARGQFFDSFDTGADNGWTHLEPLAAFGDPATYSFPNGGYRIQAGASPDPANLGPARAGSLRADLNLAGFFQELDVVGWDKGLNQSFGLLGRVTNPGFGTTRGYAFTYSTAGSISISLVNNEHVTALGSAPTSLDPANKYHFEFDGYGDVLTGIVYNQNDRGRPIALVQAEDNTYGQGLVGLYLFSNLGTGATDATLDNYGAVATVPEPSEPSLLALAAAAFMGLTIWRDKMRQSPRATGR